MLQKLNAFKFNLNNKNISVGNKYLDKVLYDFKCYIEEDLKEIIIKEKETKGQMDEPKIVVIDKISEGNDQYLVILLDKTIIVIKNKKTNLSQISSFFREEKNIIIIPVSDTVKKEDLPDDLQNKYIDDLNDFDKDNYLQTIQEFSNNFHIGNTKSKEIMNVM